MVTDGERDFREKISPFLRGKLDELRRTEGEAGPRYLALARQYERSELETTPGPEVNSRHYDADLEVEDCTLARGVEQLYRRTLVIELCISCAANCRYCLRQKYDLHTLTEAEILEVAKFCGSEKFCPETNEVLITGGDPFLVPQRLGFLVESLMRHAPNITTMRVATRLPQQDPGRVTDAVLDVFRCRPGLRFEIATQTNHAVEFFPEVRDCFARVREVVPIIYSQNVLLKGVNDSESALVELYDTMRQVGIGPHYLFHPVPMVGTHHLRPTVGRSLELVRHLTSCGALSGRAKPSLALMTDIGKITLYDGTIVDRDVRGNRLLVQSSYRLDDRLRWNASWKRPGSAEVGPDGLMRVWYLDGSDD